MTKDLQDYLETLYARFHCLDHVEQDPLRFPRGYTDLADREVVAFLAASLAFGHVRALMARCADLLSRLGPRPSKTLADLTEARARDLAAGFRHRFVGPDETASLLFALGRLLREDGGLERAFMAGFRTHGHVCGGLASLRDALEPRPGDLLPGPGFLFPAPAPTHASKRAHLFLRWVVRADGIDLGLWRSVSPAHLLMPLDVHVFRVAGFLGLVRRRSSGPRLRDAVALTEALRRLDPHDPVRYDFALSHLGISRACRGHADGHTCPACPLWPACIEGQKVRA